MIEMYCKLIIEGRRTFDKIPNEFKERVQMKLIEKGYDTTGKRLDEED